MIAKLNTFLERLQDTTSPNDLQTLVESLRDVYDISNAVYHAVNIGGAPYAAVTYDPRWGDHYHENEYVKIDPVVRGAVQRFHPMDWKRLDWSNRGARNFWHEAVECGVGNQGYSIPIRGPNGQFALFTVNDNTSDQRWQTFTREYGRDMLLISHYMHQKVLEVLKADEVVAAKELSPRERDALTLLGVGESRGRIAEALNISEHTLRVYIDSARHKLGALNTTHAVALALMRGAIMP